MFKDHSDILLLYSNWRDVKFITYNIYTYIHIYRYTYISAYGAIVVKLLYIKRKKLNPYRIILFLVCLIGLSVCQEIFFSRSLGIKLKLILNIEVYSRLEHFFICIKNYLYQHNQKIWGIFYAFIILSYFKIKWNQFHAVSRTQQDRQRGPSVKILRSPLAWQNSTPQFLILTLHTNLHMHACPKPG